MSALRRHGRALCVCIELSAFCSALLTSLLQNRTNVIHFRLSSPQRFVAVYWAFEFGICCCFLWFEFFINFIAQKIKSHLACARPDHARLTKAQEYKSCACRGQT